MTRPDGRKADALRPVTLERAANPYAEGSCLARMGGTLVLCTATVEDGVPGWRRGSGLGWLTAEYAMLPRSTQERTPRERTGPGGRTQEIQRLIGRSLRAALKSFAFGEVTLSFQAAQQTTGTEVTRRLVRLAINVEIFDQREGRMLWQRSGLTVDGEYQPPREAEGRETALKKLVNDIVDGAQSQW